MDVKQLYNQGRDGLSQLETRCQRENQLADWGLAALSDSRLSNPAKMRKKCCYCWRRTWDQYSSLSPSPAHLTHTTTITLWRIKCKRLYFYKEVCSFVHWSSCITVDYVPHIFVYVLCSYVWLYNKINSNFFQVEVVSVLLYECITWTLAEPLEKKLNGNCTRKLRAILNKSWKQHPTK